MAEIVGATGLTDEVRRVALRRNLGDVALRLSLESAERGTVWLARDEGEPIGIAVANDSETERFVGDYFVEPSFRGQGIGTRLFAAVFGEAEDLGRTMLVDIREAAAVVLALRFAMAPREALLRFVGSIPREQEIAKMAAGDYRFQVEAIDPLAHRFGLNELDRQARGTVRPADHVSLAREDSGNAFFLAGEFVGYAYVWPDGRIGPLACASEAYVVQIFAYALVTLQRVYGASWCTLLIPSSNRRVARASLRAGLRIADSAAIASDAALPGLSAYVGVHPLLL